MSERCLMKAEINKINAEVILVLASAAQALALSVPNSEAAVKAINARILESVKVPEPEKANEPEKTNGQAGEAETVPQGTDVSGLPPQLLDLLLMLGAVKIVGGKPPTV